MEDKYQSILREKNLLKLEKKVLENEKKELKNDYRELNKYRKKINDNLSARINSLQDNLHTEFRKVFMIDLDIAEWLSGFSIERQEELLGLDLNYSNCTELRERRFFYNDLVKNTPITGKQLNYYITEFVTDLLFRASHFRITMRSILDEKLKKAKTVEEIDEMFKSFKKEIEKRERESEEDKKKKEGERRKRSNHTFNEFGKLLNGLSFENSYREKYGLPKDSSDDDVNREFKKLIMLLHPDKGGNAKLFQQIKKDYDDFRKSI